MFGMYLIECALVVCFIRYSYMSGVCLIVNCVCTDRVCLQREISATLNVYWSSQRSDGDAVGPEMWTPPVGDSNLKGSSVNHLLDDKRVCDVIYYIL